MAGRLVPLTLLVLVVTGVCRGAQVDSCDPDCSASAAGDKVPDPTDCSRYYVCLDDLSTSDVPFDCAEGEKFNADGQCKVDDGTIECTFCAPKCQYQCMENSTDIFNIADRKDCKIYYICGLPDSPIKVACPSPDLYFDGEDCQTSSAVCCRGCEVYCTVAYTEIPDPYNCRKFYFCSDANYYPDESELFDCPTGEVFDVDEGHCVTGSTCTNICT